MFPATTTLQSHIPSPPENHNSGNRGKDRAKYLIAEEITTAVATGEGSTAGEAPDPGSPSPV